MQEPIRLLSLDPGGHRQLLTGKPVDDRLILQHMDPAHHMVQAALSGQELELIDLMGLLVDLPETYSHILFLLSPRFFARPHSPYHLYTWSAQSPPATILWPPAYDLHALPDAHRPLPFRLDRPGGSAFCPHLPDLCYGYIFCHVLSD